MSSIWVLGMGLNITGSVMVNFGTNLMKSSHNLTADMLLLDENLPLDYTVEDYAAHEELCLQAAKRSKRIWNFGMTIFVLGSLVNFASFAFAAQSLLAALGTVQFVSNVVFAKTVLHEELSWRVIIATAIICVGLVLAILFSNHETATFTSSQLISLYE